MKLDATHSTNRRPVLVSFSGIDGAGKSTQIEALRTKIEGTGARVQLITFWDNVATFTRVREVSGHTLFRGDKGVGSPDKPINRRDKNVRSWPMTLVRLCLYFADAVSLRLMVNKASHSDADFIIFDRYSYDEFSNLTLSNPINRAYARLLMKIVPRPHLSFLLDADPIHARARKPEYPLDFLHTSRASYMALSELIGGITIIDPMPAREVQEHIWNHVLRQLSLDESQVVRTSELIDADHRVHAQVDERDVHPTVS